MRFINTLLVAGAAFASMASAAISFTSFPSSVKAGTPVTLKWDTDDTAAPVTIVLKYGPSGNLGTVKTLTTTGKNGEFTWTPETTDGNGNLYAFEIQQGGDINYSGQFTLTGGSPNAPTVTGSLSASVASAASTAASSSASANSSASSKASTLSTATITGSASSASSSESASASAASTGKSSGASASSSSSPTSASRSASSSVAMSVPTSTGAANANYAGSPVALIFGAMAAMVYLN